MSLSNDYVGLQVPEGLVTLDKMCLSAYVFRGKLAIWQKAVGNVA